MKKIFLLPIFFILSLSTSFAAVEDNSIIKELNKDNTVEINSDSLKFKTFSSCEDLEKVTNDFLKNYNTKYGNYYGGPVLYRSMGVVDDMVMEDSVETNSVTAKSVSGDVASDNFSKTNEQVAGVSESEIIKTDGKYIYYMSDYYDNNVVSKNYADKQKKNVFIIDVNTMKVVKKIKLPKHFYGTKLYLQDDKLVILASGRPESAFQKQYWDNSVKTYTIIYDVQNPEEAKLLKAFMSEGSFSKSRLIDNMLYVISKKDSYNIFRAYTKDKEIKSEDIIPKGLEIFATDDKDEQNVEINGEKRAYNVTTGYVSKCNNIEYILPDSDTDLGYPQFNMISIIDINDIKKPANTKLVFGNLNEIYMSLDNLYMTSSVYKSEPFRCTEGMKCIMPYYYGGTNHTLIHKMNVVGDDLKYQSSVLIEGSPLTQYSMDEHKGDFRILTSSNLWGARGDRHTDLYILDKYLKLKGSLKNLGNGENFKSSRYIGDKLYLVTFKQIDPLFVIDVSDSSEPKVLGELKIPGYSTYLHPYDENHLIGLGYDTKENDWGGITTNGLKVDLYDISDFKNPKQKYSITLGGRGSYSEALKNPRMFMWNADKNKLFLPVQLFKNDPEVNYRNIDFFQGLVTLDINKDSGIKEDYRISHIDTSNIKEERTKECSKYTGGNTEQKCVKLIDGSSYCEPVKRMYVPKYCYADSTIGEYLASKNYNYRNSFVKRALWIGDKVYSISDYKVVSSDIDNGKEKESVKMR